MNELTNFEIDIVRGDGEFVVLRVRRGGDMPPSILFSPALERPAPASIAKLEHSYALRDELGPLWAARPVELVKYRGRPSLLVEDRGGEFLDKMIDGPLAVPEFLRIAVGIAKALGCLHAKGLVHRDIKPTNVIVDLETGEAWLTGFGLASRLPRHRQAPEPPEVIAGTLAYMAPEQTGRMNRSIDSRSDLYSLGVTYYEMLVGGLPFTAGDAMEWIHCHIARPPPLPSLQRSEIPEPISAIILKLLAKAPEERYQTAAGVEADLRRCLSALEAHGRIEPFLPGTRDAPDRLLVPEKLYGREAEVGLLLAAFDRVVRQGRVELVLVSGYSGVGKSSVVNELHRALVPPRAHFAFGKFDQYKRDIPYATLAQAFQSLVREILGKSDTQIGGWRQGLRDALGPNGQLMVNLIPELELIIGKQPSVAELTPQESQSRFQAVFRRLLGVFAKPEHPLVLFLDDLQWLDAATLKLLEHLIDHQEVRHLLLIGAYRENEVNPSHPLVRTLAEIRKAGAPVHEIELAPLGLEDVCQLIADALRCEPERAVSLARAVHEKTDGNPFFTIQFIAELEEEGLLVYAPEASVWIWDVDRIQGKGYTDNVVDLMIGKLNRFPEAAQASLKQLACLGNSAEIAVFSMVYGEREDKLDAAMWDALRGGLVSRSQQTYTFVHDRVQEAAYALIPDGERAAVHLRIGRALTTHLEAAEIEEKIFEIVNQLNRGIFLITSPEEREHLAELNLAAGRRSISSTAYASARRYLSTAASLLDDRSWSHSYALAFGIELHLAECEFLTGEPEKADGRLTTLSYRARDTPDYSKVACLQIEVCTATNRSDLAVEICLGYLRRIGIEWTTHPTKEQFSQEYAQFLQNLAGRPIEALIHLPLMDDPEHRATLNVLSAVGPSAFFTDENLLNLTLCRTANLSVMHGNDQSSPLAYTYLGSFLGPRFGDYETGYRLGRLGIDLVAKGLDRWKCRVYVCFGTLINPWSKHVGTSFDWIRQAFDTALEVGDIGYAGYCCQNLIPLLIANGTSLAEVQSEALTRLEFARKIKFVLVIDCLTGQVALIRQLRGLTLDFSSFDDGEFDERAFEQHLEGDPLLAFSACWYWIRKLQARFYAGDHAAALDAAAKAEPLLWTSPSFFEIAEYHFFSALSQTAIFPTSNQDEQQRRRKAIAAHQRQLAIWAKNCPENFDNRVALVAAEIARIEDRALDAGDYYEQAIRSAHANGLVHNEAVASELAAQFYAARGFETIADAYLRNARFCYLRWGADGKVQQLDRLYPHWAAPEGQRPASLNATIGTPVGQLDAETVAKASQALSSEIVLPKLIERLMRIAVEHAGAERGLLILLRGNEPLIEAEATIGHGRVDVRVRQTDITSSDLPKSALHYVIRTRQRVVLDDASVRNSYSDDEYLEQRKAKSVLCLPIVKQTKLIGVLYLENNLTPRLFTSGRVAVLDMLASQAAISLENARLYAALEQENLERKRAEEELRRSEAFLAEAQKLSCTGSFGWSVATDEHFWSDETYRIFEYEVSSKVSLQMVRERIHPEDIPLFDEVIARAANGDGLDYEYRLLLPSGAVKQVHVVAHAVRGEFVGAVMDITVTRQAEAALRQAQAQLAHVTRVTTMGELAASIAHEVNQPIAGVVINGNACLRWLARVKEESTELQEARETIQRILRDGKRAGEILGRIRALFKKAEPAKEPLDLNEAIREILLLARSEMNKHQVALHLELADDLPPALGDKVLLQQVILNLILNGIDAMNTVEDRSRDLIIRTQCSEEGVVIVTVRDSGIGLDSSSMEKVFAAFHTTKPGGLGMGLSISRSIVENHHGRLWVTAHDGPGASFHFTLLIA